VVISLSFLKEDLSSDVQDCIKAKAIISKNGFVITVVLIIQI
jgi:hypothetical protein